MKIYIAADHAGFHLKKKLIDYFTLCGIPFEDVGAKTYVPKDDYPPYALGVANKVGKTPGSRGVLICGSGTGTVIAANKIKGVRAIFGYSDYGAKMARIDNDANVITFAGRKQTAKEVTKMVNIFLTTKFPAISRHVKRVAEIAEHEAEVFK